MKKNVIHSFKNVWLSFAAILALSSCNQNLVEQNQKDDITERKSEISKNIGRMKNAGLFDSIMEEARAASNEESENVLRFINDTDSVLDEIAMDENGNEELEVINALFCSGSVNDFAESFSKLNEEKSDEFLSFVNENLVLESSSEQSSARCALTKEIKLSYAVSDYARGIFASDLEWSTIGWYTGYCAASIAGFYLASYGGFWVKVAGSLAATAGGVSMGVQLGKWASSSELVSFMVKMSKLDPSLIPDMFTKDDGVKLTTISAETLATAAVCVNSPFGQVLIGFFKSNFNSFIDVIFKNLPEGVQTIISNIPLKKI